MQENLVRSLRAQLPQIHARWAALLHAEPVSTPLACPDALVHLIDWTLDEIFKNLADPSARHRLGRRLAPAHDHHDCPCGRNPLLAYFAAGLQSMQEGLVLAQVATAGLDPIERHASLDELNFVLRQIARREIETFCGVCQHRAAPCHPPTEGSFHASPLGVHLTVDLSAGV